VIVLRELDVRLWLGLCLAAHPIQRIGGHQ
jgi:hypothetical protein